MNLTPPRPELNRKIRQDGSIYITCDTLPGFHFILGPEEDETELQLALDQFQVFYTRAQRGAG